MRKSGTPSRDANGRAAQEYEAYFARGPGGSVGGNTRRIANARSLTSVTSGNPQLPWSVSCFFFHVVLLSTATFWGFFAETLFLPSHSLACSSLLVTPWCCLVAGEGPPEEKEKRETYGREGRKIWVKIDDLMTKKLIEVSETLEKITKDKQNGFLKTIYFTTSAFNCQLPFVVNSIHNIHVNVPYLLIIG
jgi:hypothetical protein